LRKKKKKKKDMAREPSVLSLLSMYASRTYNV